MWLYTSKSFVSVVAHKDNPGLLVVRARIKDDILELFPFAVVTHTTTTDYPYRANLKRSEVAAVVSQYIADINYYNFKSSVPKDDYKRSKVYSTVWGASMDLEDLKRTGYYPFSLVGSNEFTDYEREDSLRQDQMDRGAVENGM